MPATPGAPGAPGAIADLGEVALVAALRRVLDRARPDVLVGNGDDAAVLRPSGDLVACVDSVVEGVDWLPGPTPWPAVGHRAAAVNLSDLAAMGAQPAWLLLALELPAAADADAVLQAAAGLAALADRFGCAVVGGDVGVSPGPQRWTVTALGQLDGPALRRDTARPGDAVWLVGDVGAAALGLALLRRGEALGTTTGWRHACLRAHLYPQPQVEAGLALRRTGARLACIDVSDGLGLDARRLALASGVALRLAPGRPDWLTDTAEAECAALGLDWRAACATGGDDYSLLVAAPPELDLGAVVGPDAHRIGEALPGPAGQVDLWVAGQALAATGWQHGRSRP